MGWARTIWKFNKGLVEKEGLMFLKGRGGGGDTPKHTLTRTTKKGHKVGVVVIVVLYFP